MRKIIVRGLLNLDKIRKNKLGKLLVAGLFLTLIIIYFPINRFVSHGVSLKTFLDESISLIPVFVIPYLIGATLILFMPLFFIYKLSEEDFKKYVLVFLSSTILSYLIYLIFPTYVDRPLIQSQNDIFSKLLTLLYSVDKSYNAAPSGHTFYSIINGVFLLNLSDNNIFKFFVVAGFFIIILSTLFTKQHYLLDVISGILFAYLFLLIGNTFIKIAS